MAIVNFKLKTQIMHRRLRNELAAARGGRRAGMRVIGTTLMDNLRALSPVDTRRYLRGWLTAGTEAGVYTGAIPALRPSRYHASSVAAMERYVERLEDQRNGIQRTIDARYPKGAPMRGGGEYRGLQRKLGTAERRLARVRLELDELERDPYAVVFGAGRVIDGGKSRLGLGKVSIRGKVYGGTGRLIDGTTASFIHLRNMEPHARVLEWKYGVLKTASSAAKSAGVLPVRAAYIKILRSASKQGATNGR